MGDLNSQIQAIMVDLAYRDAGNNNYTQTKSMALSKATPFFDWVFPVIDENAGEVRYSGHGPVHGRHHPGHPGNRGYPPDDRARRQGRGPAGTRRWLPAAIDFSAVKLIIVTLHYADPPNGIDERKDLTFKNGDPAKTWAFDMKNKSARDYTWSARAFMTDGSRQDIAEQPGEGDTVVPMLV